MISRQYFEKDKFEIEQNGLIKQISGFEHLKFTFKILGIEFKDSEKEGKYITLFDIHGIGSITLSFDDKGNYQETI